jgi:hypothetical protein
MKRIVLNERERMLVMALAGVVAILIPLLGVSGLLGYQSRLAGQVETNRRQLAEALALDAELTRLERSRPARSVEGSLIGYLEQLSDRAGVKQRVQLNPVSQSQPGRAQAVDVRLDQATLDELVRLLYAIENADAMLVIEQVEVSQSFKEKDLLRVSLRVLGQG